MESRNPVGFIEGAAGQWGVPGTATAARVTPSAGNAFYADSGHALANNLNDGTNPGEPLATLAGAIAKCVANNGDTVYLQPGHAETWSAAAAVVIATAGVTVIGLGSGAARPTITLTNTAARLQITAANVRVENVLFVVNVDNLTIVIDVNAAGAEIMGNELRETVGAARHWLVGIDVNGGGANVCDRTKIVGNIFKSIQAGANAAIELGAVADGVVVEGNYIYGDFADAGIHNPVANALTNLLLKDNAVANLQAGDHAIELVSACTGMAVGNRLYSDAAGTCLDPGSLMCLDNLMVNAIDESGIPVPVPASGTMPAGAIGVASFAAGALLLVEGLGSGAAATKAAVAVSGGAGSINLFTVAGGRVIIHAIIHEITTVCQAAQCRTKLDFNSTGAAAAYDMSAAGAGYDLNAAPDGKLGGLSGVVTDTMVPGVGCLCSQPVVLDAGTIRQTTADAINTGVGAYTCYWSPITVGATVVAA